MAPNGRVFLHWKRSCASFPRSNSFRQAVSKKEMAVLTYKPFKIWNLNQFGLIKSEMVHIDWWTKPCTIWYISQIFNYIYIFSIIPKCLFHPMLFKTTPCICRIKFTEHHRGCGLHPWSLTFRDPEKNGWKLEDYIPFLTRGPFVFQLQGSI